MAEFGIDVIVDPSKATPGLDKVDRRLKRTEKSAKRLGATLKRALTLVGLIAVARQVGIFADSLTNVQNRIRLVTKNTEQLNAVTKRLFDISARTRTGFSATATIFSRTALAVKDLGLSLNETLGFTEALNQAIVLSGVKAQEANAGLIQLSQGLASGTLRGDELRSVLEQLPKVADLIADQLEVARGELRLLGEQGLISTKQIINAFTGIATEDLAKAFAESIPTMSQAFSVLETRIIEFIGNADSASRISEKLARAIIVVSTQLENIAKVAIVAGAALVGPFAKAGVLFATRAVLALNAAILANPIGAMVVVLITAVVAIDQFGDSIAVSADGLVSLKDVAIATWEFIKASIAPVVAVMTDGFRDAINFISNAFKDLTINWAAVASFAKVVTNAILRHFVGLGRALRSVFKDLKAIFTNVLGDDLTNLVSKAKDFTVDALKAIGGFSSEILRQLGLISVEVKGVIGDIDPNDKSFVGTFLTVGKNAKDAYISAFKEDFVGDLAAVVTPALKQIDDAAKAISAKRRNTVLTPEVDQGLDLKGPESERVPLALQQVLKDLKDEAAALQLTNRERGIQNELLDLEDKLRKSSLTLNPAQQETLDIAVRQTTALREQAEVLDSIRGPQEQIIQQQETLNDLYAAGRITVEELTREMLSLGVAQAELNIAQGSGSFQDGFLVGIQNMLEAVRNFSAEAGIEFASFFENTTTGFADAAAQAVVFGGSFKDAIGNAARQAVAGLLSSLIQLGLQFVLNAGLSSLFVAKEVAGSGLKATAEATAQGIKTTAALASIATISAAVIASNAAIAVSAAAPAALVSLASFGANAIPASAGIVSTTAVAEGIAATAFLADGGFVRGPGGPRDDKVDAKLSNGEFVVNARATSRFRDQLELINNGKDLESRNTAPQELASGGFVSAKAPERLKPQLEAMNRAASDEAVNNQAIRDNNQSTSAGGDAPAPNISVINVLDKGIVEDFIDSPSGDTVIVNAIERNAASIGAIIGS